MLRPHDILTNYHKLAHLHSISYRIYTATDPSNEQTLLELEVQIRHDHPTILVNYYNRSLFEFRFSHVDSYIELDQLYPQLKLQLSHTASPKDLTGARNTRPAADDPGPYAGLCLLKALKKLVLYRLSCQGAVQLFGNYAVAANGSSWTMVHMDPILLPNGDVLVAMAQRTQPTLYPSSQVNADTPPYYAIYLVPSGIRCHLFGATLNDCLTTTPPSNQTTLLALLEKATGTKIGTDTTWVKLVPNLQHLNNQTSPVARFIHSVDNKKFIVWPWHLCLVQFGHSELQVLPESSKGTDLQNSSSTDPMAMISEFLDFAISVHLQSSAAPEGTGPQFSVPSIMSTASGEAPEAQGSEERRSPLAPVPEEKLDDELDDLFGDSSEPKEAVDQKDGESQLDEKESGKVGEDMIDGSSVVDTQDKDAHNVKMETNKMEIDGVGEQAKDAKPTPDSISNDSNDSRKNGFKSLSLPLSQAPRYDPPSQSFVDIPKDQMITQESTQAQMATKSMLAALKGAPPSYDDPGAPPALAATPVPPSHLTPEVTSKSSFSPIIFNPLIKNNIDTKYGKGGKFYVEKDPQVDEVISKTRATSVLAPATREGTIGLGIRRAREYEEVFEDTMDSDNGSYESDEDEAEDMMDMSLPLQLNTEDCGTGAGAVRVATTAGNAFSGAFSGAPGVPVSAPDRTSISASASAGVPLSAPSAMSAHPAPTSSFPSHPAPIPMPPPEFHLPFLKKYWSGQLEAPSPTSEGSISDNLVQLVAEEPAEKLPESKVVPSASSTNCIPLILRGINTSTIPDRFLTNNIERTAELLVVSDESDLSHGSALRVQAEALDDMLATLVPAVIFDDGLTGVDVKWKCETEGKEHEHDDDEVSKERLIGEDRGDPEGKVSGDTSASHDVLTDRLQNAGHHSYDSLVVNSSSLRVPASVSTAFSGLFPHSYNVALFEFLVPVYGSEDKASFFDELTTGLLQLDGDKLAGLAWDAVYENGDFAGNNRPQNGIAAGSENGENGSHTNDTTRYRRLVDQIATQDVREPIDPLQAPMVTVKRGENTINLAASALGFWGFLGFAPAEGPRNLQALVVCESDAQHTGRAFLDALAYCYGDFALGTMTKVQVNAEKKEGLGEIDGAIELALQPAFSSEVVDRELSRLADLILADPHGFDFRKPLLILFACEDSRFNAPLQMAKVVRNFRQRLREHQLPPLEVLWHSVPALVVFKGEQSTRNLRYLLASRLGRIAMNVYGRCSGELHSSGCAFLAVDPPVRLRLPREKERQVERTDTRDKDRDRERDRERDKDVPPFSSSSDVFLHLAYERSADKNWLVAVWLDPNGRLTYNKAWYCAPGRRGTLAARLVDEVCDELWSLSMQFFKTLVESASKNVSRRKFLVLTRVSSVIPDDELVHWKRLSVKHKDISLVVLSVGRSPTTVFSQRSSVGEAEDGEPGPGSTKDDKGDENPPGLYPANYQSNEAHASLLRPDSIPQDMPLVDSDVFRFGYGASNNTLPAIIASSPNINFASPHQILSALGNFLSPQDLVSTGGIFGNPPTVGSPAQAARPTDTERVLTDPQRDIWAVVPLTTLPTVTSPTRLALKTGYLLGLFNGCLLQYEVSLLSCSSYWSPEAIIDIILRQYKRMIVLGDIMCVSGRFRPPQTPAGVFHAKQAAEAMVPWHVSAVTKALDYLVHVEVDEKREGSR